MSISILGISAAFVFVLVVLLGVLFRSGQVHWQVKLLLSALALCFYVVVYESLPKLFGWPSDATLPVDFHLLDMQVQEPAREGDEGRIFMWVIPFDSDGQVPRAFELPYSPEMHERLTSAGERMQLGQTLAGTLRSEGGTAVKAGALPRFYFIEKAALPRKQ